MCNAYENRLMEKKGGELLGMVKFPLSLQTPVKGSLEIYS